MVFVHITATRTSCITCSFAGKVQYRDFVLRLASDVPIELQNRLCKDGWEDEAIELFKEMKAQGMIPNIISYTSLIHAFCYCGKWEEAKCLFNERVDQGVRSNAITFSVLIDMLGKADKVIEVKNLLEMMIQRGHSGIAEG
ncbi:pentatricopeptide repeat-containing protein At1g62914, mitochondrial-like [Benincasa hispida]|uniref:pentatricopeptide repeat-containing protein At1g62914, mitochondrial-like n=1 Tax=Benincasa hispida TaxID=102211 RepID=UPI001901CD00|nr:pentatricopeptide repeat-containing protein At1g62914, mitochondrial-like [Benincasa hispida]